MATIDFTRAIRARETGEILLELVTISHDDFDATIRRVDNTEDIVSRGDTWLARPTEVTLPRDMGTGGRVGRLVLDDTDLAISAALRGISNRARPAVVIEIVRGADPETVEDQHRHLEVVSYEVGETSVAMEVGLIDYRTESFPAYFFNAVHFPDLDSPKVS